YIDVVGSIYFILSSYFLARGVIHQASHPGRFTAPSVIPPNRSFHFAKQLIPNHLKKLPKSE
ncbi:MAG TPA: hypothetical protein VIK23_02570, partial [Acetobacterium sp.]